MPVKKPDDPFSALALNVFRLKGLFTSVGDQITASVGQSSARWQVLGRIHYEPRTVAQMARDMGNARQSVQRIADILVKEGLAVYKANPSDRRTQLLELTPKGLETLSNIEASYEEWAKKVVAIVDKGQLATTVTALIDIGDIIEGSLKNKNN